MVTSNKTGKSRMYIRPHTILVLVGPSGAGKSHWAKNYGLPKLNKMFPKVHYVSSDDLRRFCLGEDLHKYDPRMMGVSSQAFRLLEEEIKAVSSYPCNKDVIIVDSTGLSGGFRKSISEIADQNNYQIKYLVFDYKDQEEFYGEDRRDITDKHIRSLKNQKIQWDLKYTVESHAEFDFDIVKEEEADSLEIPDEDSYMIIGDVHNCYKELRGLIDQKDCDHYILLGDLFDKSTDPKPNEEMISYILHNDKIKCIRGNHDNFAQFYWFAKNKCTVPQEILDEHFHHALSATGNFKTLATELYKKSYDWIVTKDAEISHSPCKNKYKGKHDRASIKKQRNFRHSAGSEPLKEKLQWMIGQQERGYKYHVAGHIALTKPYVGHSEILIDTGCVYGNCLTGVLFDDGSPYFITEKSIQMDRKDKLETL